MKRGRQTLKPLPSLTMEMPPAARLAARSGPAGVMKAAWRDPLDMTPTAARTARTITGWRSYCPIRRVLHQYGARSSFTDLHVLAADRLRLDADAVAIGLSHGRGMTAAQSWIYGPMAGPSALALRNIKAWPRFRQAMALFDPEERRLVAHVVLLNHSLMGWRAEQRERGKLWSSGQATVKLVELLDRLVEHYDLDDRDSRSAA